MNEDPINKEEMIDRVANRVIDAIGRNRHIRIVRNSHILSAIVGAAGFALFVDGILKLFENSSAPFSLVLGLLFMLVTGLLIQNLNR